MPLDNLTKVNMCGAPITAVAVLMAIVGAIRDKEVPAYVRAHAAQSASWVNHCAAQAEIEFNPKEMPYFPTIKTTVGGLPIRIDNKLWPTTVVFHNETGKAVARIKGLAIPQGFKNDFPALWNCSNEAEYEERVKREGWLFE